MAYNLFDYVDLKDWNIFKEWSQRLEKTQLAKLNAKLDSLQTAEPDLVPGLYDHTRLPHIKKLKIRGNVQLRPRLCRGPIEDDKEFTLLLGAREIGGKDDPTNACEMAEGFRQQVKTNPAKRRCTHEKVWWH